jgi:hypothetical protein
MSLSAENAADRVEQLIVLTERLTAKLDAEARAFEERRPHDAAKGADETGRLANLYRYESARVRADPSLIAGAPKPRREALIQATEAFEAVLARHGRALYAAKVVTEGLVQAIAEEIVAGRAANAGYNPKAQIAAAEGSAIALNKRA